MAQSGFTPIQLYFSSTTTNVPLAANLAAGELAINTIDGKLFYKDSSGVVQTIASKATGSIAGSNTQVQFNNSGVLGASANLTFNGTILTSTGFAGPLNGTVGATTPAAGAFTTLSASGIATFSAGSVSAPAITTTGDTNTGIFFPVADTIAFTEGGVESMRINSTGYVGIGVTSIVGKLDVQAYSTGLANGIMVRNSAGSGTFAGFTATSISSVDITAANIAVSTPTSINFWTDTGGGVQRAVTINSTGGFSVGTTSDPGTGAIYATGNITAFFSDDRLKTRHGKIENALDKLQTLDGFYYTPNQVAQDLGYAPTQDVGVSAQAVQAIMPEVVAPAPIDDKYLTVRYEKLVPLLIEAIKELKAEVDDLKGNK